MLQRKALEKLANGKDFLIFNQPDLEFHPSLRYMQDEWKYLKSVTKIKAKHNMCLVFDDISHFRCFVATHKSNF